MKRIFIAIILSLLIAGLFAIQVSSTEATTIATNWMSQISSSNTVSNIEAVNAPNNISQTDWYVVSFAQGGFVLISADDTVMPILGYGPTGRFNTTNLPENIAWYMSENHEQIAAIRNEANIRTHPAWQAIRQNDFTGYIPNRNVSPLLVTNWNQDWPYNSMCPAASGGPGGHVYAGCGATTMGQIMKYWAYPTHGTGTHTYSHPTYGTLTADFGAATYNYTAMPNELGYSPNTSVSTLLFHCGVALNMDYAIDGSGASVNVVRPAFVNYFNFEASATTVYKASNTATNWDTLLRNELDHNRPIFYFGTDPANGGHAFVCDGYQGTNYFHMNWGWSGYNNGYFYVANLNPDMYAFNSQQGAVIGLQPAAAVAAPTGLSATVDMGNNVLLQWISPLSRSLTGFSVYRNNVLFTTVEGATNTNCYDINLEPGTYQYYVIANFSQGDSQPSNFATATIYPPPVINCQESFETYSDFNTTLSPWFTYDLDMSPTAEFANVDFPAEGTAMSYIVLNPATTSPAMTDLTAYYGQKMLACFATENGANNDWLVSPQWNTGSIGKFRFWARSAYPDSGLEQIKIGVSTTSPDPSTMTFISGSTPIAVPGQWTEYTYNLTGYLNSDIFVGIECVTNSGSILLLDRMQLWSSYVANDDNIIPATPAVSMHAYPNPFNGNTRLNWVQKDADNVTVKIYDVKGHLVKTLLDGKAAKGSNEVIWNGQDNAGKPVAEGIYFSNLKDKAGHTSTQKLVRMK